MEMKLRIDELTEDEAKAMLFCILRRDAFVTKMAKIACNIGITHSTDMEDYESELFTWALKEVRR